MVSLTCRDSLARGIGSPTCSTVDFNMDWPMCEVWTLTDATALRKFAKLSGASEVGLVNKY